MVVLNFMADKSKKWYKDYNQTKCRKGISLISSLFTFLFGNKNFDLGGLIKDIFVV